MGRAIRVYLDGVLVNDKDLSGIEGVRINIDTSNSDGVLGISFGSAFVFSGAAYAHIISQLVDAPNARQNRVVIRVESTCCTNEDGTALVPFTGLITFKEISWCERGQEKCTITANALEYTVASEKINCLRNSIIHATRNTPNGRRVSDGEDEGRAAKYIAYYEETRPYFSAVLSLYVGVTILMLTLTIRALITALTFGFIPFQDTSTFILNAFARKRFHKAPFVSSYLLNACKLCGLQLRAPLFQQGGAYYNMMRLDAPYQEGGRDIVDARLSWQLNRPNFTFAEFFASFKELNLAYSVTDTTLIFDRIDRIKNQLWIDFSTDERLIYEQCYEGDDTVQPAMETFEYQQDGTDKIGNEAIRIWSNEVVDYNTPINPALSGVRRTNIQFGAARFLEDGQKSALLNVSNSAFYTVATLGTNPIDRKAMLMSMGTCDAPKLLIWDGVSPQSNAHILRQRAAAGYHYSAPTWLHQDAQTITGTSGFYNNLLRISDPRLNLKKNLVFRLRFRYLCKDLRTIGYGKYVLIRCGNGVVRGDVQSIEIDLQNGEMTITGVI